MRISLIVFATLLALSAASCPFAEKGTPCPCCDKQAQGKAGLPLLPRSAAPQFTAPAVINEKFETVSLSDYTGKYVVLVFYPFDFTFVCPTELISYSDSIAKFRELGAEVLGISTDSHHTHLAWIRTERTQGGVGKLEIPLVADISKDISKSYGVLVNNPQDELYGAALRGLFIIDGKGIIRSVQINDAPVGRNVDETLRLITAFQYADEHGEVCPANWKPGKATIIPDHDKKTEYFSKSDL